MEIDVEWTEGVCQDGAVLLRNGKMMTITEVLAALNKGEINLAHKRKALEVLNKKERRHEIDMADLQKRYDKVEALADKFHEKLIACRKDRNEYLEAIKTVLIILDTDQYIGPAKIGRVLEVLQEVV